MLVATARAWSRKREPCHPAVYYTKIEPGYFYQGDHTQLDFWCMYKGKLIRAWLTTFQDMRSRCIVGWNICGGAPNQDAILAALRMAFQEWAIPSVMRVDNGKDFTSKAVTGYTKQERDRLRRFHGAEWQQIERRSEHLIDCDDPRWLGVTGELGIRVILARPYSPQSKGVTERLYGTIQTCFSRMQSSYCGHSPQTKPECVEKLKCDPDAVPTLEKVREDFAAWLDIYHRTAHGGLDGDTPMGVWKTATRLRKALADELSFLMGVRGLYKVGANGVRVTVGAGPVWYGAKSAALKRHVGRKVLIAVDAEDVSHAYAYTPDRDRRQLIGRLEPNEFIEPLASTDDAREAIAEKRREQAVMHKARRAYAQRTRMATQRINEHSRAHRAELLTTGTEGVSPPRIVPVRTGFEGTSKPDRSRLEESPYCPPSPKQVAELFGEEEEPLGGLAEAPDLSAMFAEDDWETEPDAYLSLDEVL